MIERLNFYDLYGYLIPGFVLVSLFWLPFGWAGRGWPPTEWASAAAALAASYVVGILLQSIGTEALPSKTRVAEKERHPSDILLDEKKSPFLAKLRSPFSEDFKAKLRDLINKDFCLTVATDVEVGADDTARRVAFRECRAALIANKMAAYAEQFQGLYALHRGLLLSIGLAIPFYLGWAIGVFHTPLVEWGWWSVADAFTVLIAWYPGFAGDDIKRLRQQKLKIVIVVVIVLLIVVGSAWGLPTWFAGPRRTALWIALPFVLPLATVLLDEKRLRSHWGRLSIGLSTLVVVGASGFVAAGTGVTTANGQRLLGCAVACIVALFPLWLSYRAHAERFAATVYSDYYAMRKLAATTISTGGRD